jgi:hypothetical protein
MHDMTDRELLELAAKAAGIVLLWHERWGCWYDHSKRNEGKDFVEWNPLTDDGDALRLAVKCGIDILIQPTIENDGMGNTTAYPSLEENTRVCETHNDDPYAATRRAIVRAAAEIGKEMK